VGVLLAMETFWPLICILYGLVGPNCLKPTERGKLVTREREGGSEREFFI
jgi:hypothetical protein